MSNNEKKSVEIRSWGTYEILYQDEIVVVKKLVIHPGHRFSYQTHAERAERWVFIQGKGEVTLNDASISVTDGSMIEVLRGDKHRAKNTGTENLIFIEVMTGHYDELDNVRLADDYGRGMSKE